MQETWKQWQILFCWAPKSEDGDFSCEIKWCLLLGIKGMTTYKQTTTYMLDSILKSRHITLPTKVHIVKAIVFPVVMYGFESWTIKTAEHQRIDAFELWCWRRLLRVLWRIKEIKPVNSKGIPSWLFIRRIDAEAEAPILRPPDAKSQLIWIDPDSGKGWGQEEKRATENEMVGWDH